MDRKVLIGITIVIVAVLCVGAYMYFGTGNSMKEVSPLTESFDFSVEPINNWDENNKELTFKQDVKSINGKDYKNIKMNIEFYKEGKLIDTQEINVNNTTNGKFHIEFTKKLQEEPEEFYYNVIEATEAK